MRDPPVPNPNPRPTPSEANAEVPVSASSAMPREIGPYQVQRIIGSGGMATVYAALQKQPRRTVALKVMKASIVASRGESALRRFKREIEILGKLHHPYIAAVYDAGTFDDGGGATPYFVMEYISGATTILEYAARKDLDLRDRLKLFVKVCAAVEHGHRNRVIHRDLKPGNILIDQYGEPKVIDFGIAHAAEVDVSHQTLASDAGNLVGTLQYMAPEQVDRQARDLDGRCDVYALGVLLYKMLTGKPPYDLEALPVYEAVRVICEETPPPPGEVKPEVNGDLETIILKAMERERERRYRTAGSLGRDVVRFLANKPIHARRAGLVYRAMLFAKRNAVVLGVIAVVAVSALAALGYSLWERSRLKERERQRMSQREHEFQQERDKIEARAAAATQAVVPAAPLPQPFTLAQHTARITGLLLTPSAGEDLLLTSASQDHALILWDLDSREARLKIDPLDAPIGHITVAADGSTLAIAGQGEGDPVVIVRCIDGKVIRTLRDVDGEVRSLAMGPSGEVVAWGSSSLTLTVRPVDARADAARPDRRAVRSATGALTAIALSRDGRGLAAGSERGVVYVSEREPRPEPRAPQRLTGLQSAVIAARFIGDDALRLACVSDDGHAMIWSQSEGGSWSGSPFRVSEQTLVAAAFSADGSHLALVAGDDAQVWAIDATGMKPPEMVFSHKPDETPCAVAVDDDGKWLALGMVDGDVRMIPVNR